MSIATSILIHPSRCLVLCVLAMVGLSAFALIEATTLWSFSARIGAIGTFLLIAGVSLRRFFKSRVVIRLDVTGDGVMILRRQLRGVETESAQVQLAKSSTLWEHLLILHLIDGRGHPLRVAIARDSISTDDFRRLSVALKWIAAHRNTEQLNANDDLNAGNF